MSYTYGVKRGESIPVVMVSQLKKTLFVAMPAPYDPIERSPVLWSDIVSPMRRQYEDERRKAGHLDAVAGPYSVHYPMESERVEFSGFFKRPLALRFSVVVDLSCHEETAIVLRLTSASALEVSFGSEKLLGFYEYRRNQETSHDLSLTVGRERQRLTITVDDYA